MSRTVKKPEVRKDEIVRAAEDLFREKGYDRTSVSDIVKKVGVAHGLFYYYFDSKENIIDAIVQRLLEESMEDVKALIDSEDMDAEEKLKQFLYRGFNRKKNKMYLASIYMGGENKYLAYELSSKMIPQFSQHLAKIVEQGVEEGVFHTKYPKRALEYWMYGRMSLVEKIEQLRDIDTMKEYLVADAYLLERMLGTKEGLVREVYSDIIEEMIQSMKGIDGIKEGEGS